jgi:Domain of unknown function (DUF4167)
MALIFGRRTTRNGVLAQGACGNGNERNHATTPNVREMSLLNNRQPGRRRGRTGQRPQGNNGRNQEQGNRIDNRARGNAPQMLEKYKALARDAQMQGDRVITEYYLQFADHYFRVVAEMRARQEETRRQRDDWQGDDTDQDMGDTDDQMIADAGDQDDDQAAAERAYEAQRRQPRQQRDNYQREGQQRDNRPRDNRGGDGDDGYRQNRGPRRDGRDNGGYDGGQREAAQRDGTDRNHQVRRVFAEARGQVEPATIDAAVLPPAFGSDGPISPIADLVDVAEAASEAPPKRRGRPRKAVADDAVA